MCTCVCIHRDCDVLRTPAKHARGKRWRGRQGASTRCRWMVHWSRVSLIIQKGVDLRVRMETAIKMISWETPRENDTISVSLVRLARVCYCYHMQSPCISLLHFYEFKPVATKHVLIKGQPGTQSEVAYHRGSVFPQERLWKYLLFFIYERLFITVYCWTHVVIFVSSRLNESTR